MSTNPAIEPKVRNFESVEGADIGSRSKSDGLFANFYLLIKACRFINFLGLSRMVMRILCGNENFVFPGIKFRLVSYNILAQVINNQVG